MSATHDPIPQADFQSSGHIGVYRPSGSTTTAQLADMLTFALRQSLDLGHPAALLNITGVYGFASPGPAYRRWLIGTWASLFGARLKVAVVARHEHVCPEKTGLLLAAEEGLRANIFVDNEADAATWLAGNSGLWANRPSLRESEREH